MFAYVFKNHLCFQKSHTFGPLKKKYRLRMKKLGQLKKTYRLRMTKMFTYVFKWDSQRYFAYVVPGLFLFSNRVRFVKSCRPIFCDNLARIISNKWVLFPLFSTAPPNVTPIASPVCANLGPPSNTDLIRYPIRTD